MDKPVCRAALVCPLCGHDKDRGLVMCWPCHRGGRHIQHFGKEALDAFEYDPRRQGEYAEWRSTLKR